MSNVLIVDDDASLRRLLGAVLERHGYRCQLAACEEEALKAMEEWEISVVVMDLWLTAPGDRDELALLQTIKHRVPEVECIILTGHATQETAIRAVNLGAYSYLTKPCNHQQLALTVQRAHEKRQVHRDLRREKESLERRVAERTAELERINQHLAHASSAKDEFLASMSHELRTPLNSILGLAETLIEQTYGPLNEKQRHYLESMADSGRHLLYLINDILDIAKIEANRLDLFPEGVDLRMLGESALRMIEQAARKKHLCLAMDIAADIETVHADEKRLKQILLNLLGNAVKFTPDHGQVGLEASYSADRHWLRISVRDTGIGIDPDKVLDLFDPFTQLYSGLSRQYTGTGLGLSLVRKLTGLHRGQIEVQTAPDQGSRFTILLPIPPANESPRPENHAAPVRVLKNEPNASS